MGDRWDSVFVSRLIAMADGNRMIREQMDGVLELLRDVPQEGAMAEEMTEDFKDLGPALRPMIEQRLSTLDQFSQLGPVSTHVDLDDADCVQAAEECKAALEFFAAASEALAAEVRVYDELRRRGLTG
jgi:hypothetical protein